MYEFFKGILVEKSPTHAILETGGIGYKLYIPQSLFDKLPKEGSVVLLYASWVVREMSQTLYGFLDKEQRSLFEQMLQISGIGPKTALSLIGHYTPTDLETIIRNEDAAALAQVPGIGKKTAEKLLVDLRNRLKLSPLPKGRCSFSQDALSALLRLGYSQTQAEYAVHKALKELPQDPDLPTLITAALKYQKK